jgi:hypothetical protein
MAGSMTAETLLYEQHDFPIFQNRMYDTAEEARQCPRGNIRLVQNRHSGLIYNAAFRPELMVYDSAYQNEQAHSPFFQSHLDLAAGIVERLLGNTGLVEVGCGKAYFLELLQSRGCAITGFDPTYEGNNEAVKSLHFAKGVNVSARGILLRHVLEHVQDPMVFLSALRDANNGGGLVYIEVPCFEWILSNSAWFDIFYEHVNYFRLSDFSRMFACLIESGHLFGGQYLYVVADLSKLREPLASEADRIDIPKSFLPEVVSKGNKSSGGPIAVWGAASKGVIYALLRERAGNPIKTLIDINPAKCDRFVPATGLRVISAKEAMATIEDGSEIAVMNSNYLEEIRKMTGNRFNFTGPEFVLY